MIYIKYRPNPQGLREAHIQPQMVDRPMKKNKEIKRDYCVLAPTLTSSCDFTPAFVIVVILPLFFENEA